MRKIIAERLFYAFAVMMTIGYATMEIVKIVPWELSAGIFIVLWFAYMTIPLLVYCYSKPIIFKKRFKKIQKIKQIEIETYAKHPFPYRA